MNLRWFIINNITVFFDYNCPFCYISFNIIEELKNHFDINCIYKPCELYPFIESDGMLKDELMAGYDIDNIYKKLRILGSRNSIEFGLLDKKYNSHMSLLLAEYAQMHNKITDFSKLVFEEYYNKDKDISNEYLLKEIYNKINLNYDQAIKEIENGSLDKKLIENHELKEKLNIELLPTYIVNDYNVLSGILTKRTFLKTFESLK